MSSINIKQSATKWDEAIGDARKHIERLRTVIVVCEEKTAAGEPWPGEEQIKRQLREQQGRR
jgi:hypothetical protein